MLWALCHRGQGAASVSAGMAASWEGALLEFQARLFGLKQPGKMHLSIALVTGINQVQAKIIPEKKKET